MAENLKYSNLNGLHYFGVVTTGEGRKGVPLLLEALAESRITTFQFNDCGCIMDAKIMETFAPALVRSEITHLYLPFTKMDDKAVMILAKAIDNSKLVELNLQGNFIGTEGAAQLLSHSLDSNLKKLNLLNANPFPLLPMGAEFKKFLRKIKPNNMELLLDPDFVKKSTGKHTGGLETIMELGSEQNFNTAISGNEQGNLSSRSSSFAANSQSSYNIERAPSRAGTVQAVLEDDNRSETYSVRGRYLINISNYLQSTSIFPRAGLFTQSFSRKFFYFPRLQQLRTISIRIRWWLGNE